MKRLVILTSAALLVAELLTAGAALCQPAPSAHLFSIKFLCGLQTASSASFSPPMEPPVKPGNYATAINIHNFHSHSTELCKKAVIANPEDSPRGAVSCCRCLGLQPDQAFEVDCNDIVTLFKATHPAVPLPSFIKGFVELTDGADKLSVTAVYTAQTCYNPRIGVFPPDSQAIFPGFKPCTKLGELDLEVVPQTEELDATTACANTQPCVVGTAE